MTFFVLLNELKSLPPGVMATELFLIIPIVETLCLFQIC